jgi:predicted membrane protein
MEQQDINQNYCQVNEKARNRGRIIAGILLIFGSICYILDESKTFQFPEWFFSWKMFLITIGLIVGVKHNFKKFAWLVLILIGLVGLIGQDFFPNFNIENYLWPIVLMVIGLIFIIKPKRKFHPSWHHHHWKNKERFKQQFSDASSEDYIDFNVIFGGIKKNIFSKDFKGGEINNVFGGSEINLTQADFTGTIRLEINNVFGGTKLIIPPHWQVKSELTTVMGGIEDRRTIQPSTGVAADKIIILEGNTFFGGIDIRNF